MSWQPDATNPYARRPGLTVAERRWLEQTSEVPTSSRVRRPHTFANRMLLAASECATAVRNATVAVPPPNRREVGSRGIVGPSDPSLAQVEATHHAVERACVRLGHIVDDCLLCEDDGAPLSCNTSAVMTLARLVGDDFTELADHLVGLSATSPKALAVVTGRFDTVFAKAAVATVDVWDDMHQGGAEAHELRDYIGRIVEVTSRLNAVKGLLAQWLPGTQVRLCKNGCGRPAPELRPGALERGGGAQCRRCLETKTA